MIASVHPAAVPLPTSVVRAEPKAAFDLISTYSTRNLGDAAIMRAMASLVPGGIATVHLDTANAFKVPGLKFRKNRSTGRVVRISVGGDIFNNSRPSFVTRNFIEKLIELGRAPGSTIAFGQTIPASCRGIAFTLLSSILKALPAVVVRDTESWKLLRSAGVSADLSWDAAFVTEPTVAAFARAKALFEQAGIAAARTTLMSVRPFDAMYPADQKDFEASITAIAKALIERGHDVALLIQSDVASWDEDRTCAARIAEADPRIRIIDCLADQEDPDPVATLTALLALANIAVGVRYHTSVLRLAAGRQPYNLYYSRKGADLQRRLGLAGCHISDCGASGVVAAIEATSNRAFDATAQKSDVREQFSAAIGKALA